MESEMISRPSATINAEVELVFLLDINTVCRDIHISRQHFIYEALFRELLRCKTIIKKTSPRHL